MAVMTGWRPLPGKRRWWTFAAVVMARVGRSHAHWVDFQDPVPSFERLVTEYGKSPYCARLIRYETWF